MENGNFSLASSRVSAFKTHTNCLALLTQKMSLKNFTTKFTTKFFLVNVLIPIVQQFMIILFFLWKTVLKKMNGFKTRVEFLETLYVDDEHVLSMF